MFYWIIPSCLIAAAGMIGRGLTDMHKGAARRLVEEKKPKRKK